MEIGFFEEKFRKEILDRLEECEKMCGGLKWIAVKGLPISKYELKQYEKAKQNLANKIDKISKELCRSVKTKKNIYIY